MEGVGRIQRANDFVNRVKEDATGNTTATGIALDEIAKIINIHVGVGQREREWLAAGNDNRRKGDWHSWHSRHGRARST
jgi:hypothetical protein